MCINKSYGETVKFWGSNGIRTHDLRDTGAMLDQPRWKQVRCEFNLYPLYEEDNILDTYNLFKNIMNMEGFVKCLLLCKRFDSSKDVVILIKVS